MSRSDFFTLASARQVVMYRVKVAMNSSRIWHNHFRKLMAIFFYPCKNKLNSLFIEDESWNYLISLNWLNLCYYRCENATHVVNNYDWFLSIYKRSLSTKFGKNLYLFYHFNFDPENFITTMAYTYDIRENFVRLSFHFH